MSKSLNDPWYVKKGYQDPELTIPLVKMKKDIIIASSKVDHFLKTLNEKKDAFINMDMKKDPPTQDYYELLGWVDALEYVLNKFSEKEDNERH